MNPIRPISIKTDEHRDTVHMRIDGEVSMATAPDLRNRLVPLYCADKKIVIDLSSVSFMDSAGVATLVEGLRWSRRQHRAFILSGVRGQVKDLISLVKLDHAFTIIPSARAAD